MSLSAQEITSLRSAIQILESNPDQLQINDLVFFRECLEKHGAKLPPPKKGSVGSSNSNNMNASSAAFDGEEGSDSKGKQEVLHGEDLSDSARWEVREGATLGADYIGSDKLNTDSGDDNELDRANNLKAEAQDLANAGKLDAAIATLTDALKIKSSSAMWWALRADFWLKKKRGAEAIADATQALSINPDSARALRVRGTANRHLCQWEQATLDLSAAQKLDFQESVEELLKVCIDFRQRALKEANSKCSDENDAMACCCEYLQQKCKDGVTCQYSHQDRGQPCQHGAQCHLGHATRTQEATTSSGGTASLPPEEDGARCPLRFVAADEDATSLAQVPGERVTSFNPRTPVVIPTAMSVTMEQWILSLPPSMLKDSDFETPQVLLGKIRLRLNSVNPQAFIKKHNLTIDEAMGCTTWTAAGSLYSTMNKHMRNGDQAEFKFFEPFAYWLSKGLAKLPDYNGVVYRTWGTKDITVNYTAGTQITFNQFSATANELTKDQLQVFGKFSGALLVLDVQGGKQISELSLFSSESEVILMPGWQGVVNGGVGDAGRRYLGLLLELDLTPFTIIEMRQRNLPKRNGLTALKLRAKFELLVRIAPRSTHLSALAMLLHRLFNDYNGAKEHFYSALRVDPNCVMTHTTLADLLHEGLRDYAGARKHYELALQIDPSRVLLGPVVPESAESNRKEIHCKLARLDIISKDYQGAKKHYELALKIDPNSADTHLGFAALLIINFKDPDGGRKHYETASALKINLDCGCSHFNVAIAIEKLFKDYNGARKHYEKALEIDPNFVEARLNLATLLKEQFNDPEGGRKHVNWALQIDPNRPDVHSHFAELLRDHDKDYNGAKKHFEKALELDPKDEVVHYDLGRLLNDYFTDWLGARRCYELTLSINPKYAMAHHRLADLLMWHLKDYNGAKEHYEIGLELNPDDLMDHRHLAMLLRDVFRDSVGAKKHMDAALAIDPNCVF